MYSMTFITKIDTEECTISTFSASSDSQPSRRVNETQTWVWIATSRGEDFVICPDGTIRRVTMGSMGEGQYAEQVQKMFAWLMANE